MTSPRPCSTPEPHTLHTTSADSDRSALRSSDLVAGSGLLLGAGALYALSGARHLLGGDNAEFVALAHQQGVAHPSGYPLFVLYVRALSWLPGSSPAHSTALATALLGAASVGMLFVAARRWGATPAGAITATLVYALSPRSWNASSHAEVFALNALLAGSILALCARRHAPTTTPRLGALGLLAGLALSNHLSALLLAPIGVYAVVLGLAEVKRPGRALWLTLFAFGLGLLPYLSLLGPPPPADHWSWGAPNSLTELMRHVSRADYGTTELGLAQQQTSVLGQMKSLINVALADLLWLPALAAVAAAACWRSQVQSNQRRIELAMLLLTLLAAGPLFVGLFNLAPEGLGLSIIERFYVLPELVLALITALALSAPLRSIEGRLRAWPFRGLAAVTLVLLALVGAVRSWPEVQEHHSRAVEAYLRNALATAPPRAVLLGTGDHRLFGFDCLRSLGGVRRDVVYVDVRLLHYDWYRARVDQRLGFELPQPVNGNVDTVRIAQAIQAQQRPLLLSNVFSPAIVKRFATSPLGVLVRVHPPGELPPSPAELTALNLRLLAGYDLDYPLPNSPSSWAYVVHQEYALPLRTLARSFALAGQDARARLLEHKADQLLGAASD